jgi:peptidyl-Lys metalloendopeptidase
MATFKNCNDIQKDVWNEALKHAERIANEAKLLLSCTPYGNRLRFLRYKEWFGEYNEERYAKVTSNFERIWDSIANKDIIFNCIGEPGKCKDTDGGYTYHNKPYEIFLCYSARMLMTGTDSKAGMIIHEMSHFDVVVGTDDITYGQSACRKLAVDNPSDAIDNADNYKYFAENDPSLSISDSLVSFASSRCVNKPFSVKANLMPKLRILEKHNTSLRDLLKLPIMDSPI